LDDLTGRRPDRILLRRQHWQEMLDDVRVRQSEEACGLVAGSGESSTAVIPMTNALHSRVRYRLEPAEQLAAFLKIDENDWELLAIYHSHLEGLPKPSQTDIAEVTYPDVAYLIWARSMDRQWVCRGYRISEEHTREIEVAVIEDE
jgi:proteasome lid subunit RPN8/RPN11